MKLKGEFGFCQQRFRDSFGSLELMTYLLKAVGHYVFDILSYNLIDNFGKNFYSLVE
jgi:hypothetical protein